MNRPPNPYRRVVHRLESFGNAAAGRGDYTEAQLHWNQAAQLKARGIAELECCNGTGYADYAAVPCPNPTCATKKPKEDTVDWTIAEVKAKLASLGAQLEPEAVLQQYTPPAAGTSVAICIVEAVTADYTPDYCIHGFASCISCNQLCYLGSETSTAVSERDREIYPMCMDCARERLPDNAVSENLAEHLSDHRRAGN